MTGLEAHAALVVLQAVAEAFIEGDCFSTEVTTAIRAATGAAFDIVETCSQDSFAVGDAFASTAGDAEGVRSPSLANTQPTSRSRSWR